MGKLFSNQKFIFLAILIIFAGLYASVLLPAPALGTAGVIAFVLIALTQALL
ncbi:MAG: hypothetical protein WCY55_06155 [Anaerovoracaceae bacterium]